VFITELATHLEYTEYRECGCGFMVKYRPLLIEYRALLIEYRALLIEYRALFIENRPLFADNVPDTLDRSLEGINLLLILNVGLF